MIYLFPNVLRSNNRRTSCLKFSVAPLAVSLTRAASATARSDVLTDNQSRQLSLCVSYHGSRCHDDSPLYSLIFLQNSGAIVLFECLYKEKFSHH